MLNQSKNAPLIESKYIYQGIDTEVHKNGEVYRVVETGQHWGKKIGFVVWVSTEEDRWTRDVDFCKSFSIQDFNKLFWKI